MNTRRPMTAVEAILAGHTGADCRAGDIVVADVDLVMAQDGNAPLAIRLFEDELGRSQTFDPERVVLVIDHCGPSPTEGASNLQRLMRGFAQRSGAMLLDVGEGISHVLLPELGLTRPGSLVVGSDSHSVTYGALNCLGTGMGSTDIAVAMAFGRAWFRVPETIDVRLVGALPDRASAKDVALELVRRIGVDGATYCCLQIGGPGLASLGMDARFTVCNMSVEMGAKCSLMPVDEAASTYLASRGVTEAGVWSDKGCEYAGTVEVDLETLEPLVAVPHDLTTILRVRDVAERRVDQAFLGTCTNSRIEDLRDAARVLAHRRVAPGVRLIVTPGSRSVYLAALREGLIETFIEAGAVVTPPGCGPCVGTHLGIPADGETVISTANRNFRGRMGNREAEVFLASPETVAASAVVGRIVTREEVA